MQCCTYTHDKLSLHRALMLERIKVQSCYWTTFLDFKMKMTEMAQDKKLPTAKCME